MLPPRTQNTRGNEGTIAKISCNLDNNWILLYLLIVRCPERLYRRSCKFVTVAPETLTLHQTDSPILLPSLHPVSTASAPLPSVRGNWLPVLTSFYFLNFVSRFPIGCLLTLPFSNRFFKVKSSNPVSSLAADDLTFATRAVACVNPIRDSYRFLSIPFKTLDTVINPRELVVYFTTLAVTGHIASNSITIDKC